MSAIIENSPTNVDPEAVNAFIQKAAQRPKSAASRTGKKRGRPAKNNRDATPPAASEPSQQKQNENENPPGINIKPAYKFANQADSFTKINFDLDGIGTVDVTLEERESYLKALLFGKPWQIEIKLAANIKYTIRALTEAESEEIRKETEKFAETSKIPANIILFYQKCSVAKQVISGTGYTPYNNPQSSLQELIENTINKLPVPVWNAAFTAVRIFEAKRVTCQNNILNDSFWTPAGLN